LRKAHKYKELATHNVHGARRKFKILQTVFVLRRRGKGFCALEDSDLVDQICKDVFTVTSTHFGKVRRSTIV
jgi:hypothetical protein